MTLLVRRSAYRQSCIALCCVLVFLGTADAAPRTKKKPAKPRTGVTKTTPQKKPSPPAPSLASPVEQQAPGGSKTRSTELTDPKVIYLQAGAIGHSIGNLAANEKGESGTFGSLLPTVGAKVRFPFSWVNFGAEAAYTVFGSSMPDETGSTTVLTLAGPIGFSPFFDFMDIKVGGGLLLYFVNGAGGKVDLNNGSTTTTFARPSETRTSTLTFLDAGIGFSHSIFRLDLDAMVLGVLGDRRSFSAMARVGVGVF